MNPMKHLDSDDAVMVPRLCERGVHAVALVLGRFDEGSGPLSKKRMCLFCSLPFAQAADIV